MKWFITLLFPLFLCANEPFFTSFAPPKGWLIADPNKYEPGVKIGFIESNKRIFSPSITLSLEKVGNVDLKTYVKAVQKNFESDRNSRYQELGTLHTHVGKAHLAQIDKKVHWGEIRLLQAVTIYQGYAIIQTAATLKKDFLSIHETFLNSFKSLTTFPTLIASCTDPLFQEKINRMMKCWKKYRSTSKDDNQTLFKSSFFQDNQWKPFVNYVENKLDSQGSCWKLLAITHIRETLLTENDI